MRHATPRQRRKPIDVVQDPKIGDKVRNRSALEGQTRRVTDRTLGGEVHYRYHQTRRWDSRCSLKDWQVFCTAGRVTFLEIANGK
jgi:hypothetical protein